MDKRKVVLICEEHLLGEGLAHLLKEVDDVQIAGCWTFSEPVLKRLADCKPDLLLLIAEENLPGDLAVCLTGQILEAYPNLPVIRVSLEDNAFQVYTTQRLPAQSAQLLKVIRGLPSVT